MLRLALISTQARRASLPFAALAFAAKLRFAAAEPSAAVASANLTVKAEPSCTNRADVIARVRARSPRVRFVDHGEGLVIRARVEAAASGAVVADVTLASPGTKPSLRHVNARSCTEAADAVALIIAVTLDPTSVGTRIHPSTAKTGSVPTLGEPSSVDGEASRSDLATSPAVTASSPTRPPSAVPIEGMQETHALNEGAGSGSRFTVGAQLAAESLVGLAPRVMPGVALFTIVGLERPSVFSPALVLAAHHAFRTGVQEQGGKVSFKLDAATLDVCPLRLRWAVLEARPCASALIGRFAARATDTINPAAESARPFGVLGGAVIVAAHLGGVIEASARLAVGANLVRDSFEFSPAIFHTVPPVSAAGSIGIGVRWR